MKKILKYSLKYATPLLLLLMLVACNSSNKALYSPETMAKLKTDIEQRNYEIEFDAAYPLMTNSMVQLSNSGLLAPGNSASRIDLTSTPNFLKVEGDSITSQLPFFGEQRLGSGIYNSRRVGIDFDGLLEDYTSTYNEIKGGYDISFEAEGKSESYDANLRIYDNGRCELNLVGTSRTPIRFTGRLMVNESVE